MQITPYLNFNGTCAEALEFYGGALGAKTLMMQYYRDLPDPQDWAKGLDDLVLHARIEIGGNLIMASDSPPSFYKAPAGISIQTSWPDVASAQAAFDALAEGAEITMPFGETFWAAGFGSLTDRFGIPWMVNCDTPAS